MTLRHSLTALVVILAVLSCVSASSTAKKSNCTKLETKFSENTKAFFGCAIKNAEPVRYCTKCGQIYANVTSSYTKLFANETCRAKYFNQDRLNILEMVYLSTQSVWNAGSCSNCYDWVDGNDTQHLSNTTLNFFDELQGFQFCVHQYNNETACSTCLSDYNIVNGIYKDIQKATNDNFCFDIKDAMNKTRLNWSHNLKCCKDRKTSLTNFIVTSVVISVLIPFVYYTSFMFYGWRREQLQQPLADSDIHTSEERAQTIETVGPSRAITNLLDVE